MTVKRLAICKPTNDEIKRLATVRFHEEVLNIRIGPFVFYHPSLRWFLSGNETVVALCIRVSDDNPIDRDNSRSLDNAVDRLIRKYESIYFKNPPMSEFEDFIDYYNSKYNQDFPVTIHLNDGRQISFPPTDHNLIDQKFTINTQMDQIPKDQKTVKLGGHNIQYLHVTDTEHIYNMVDILDALNIKDISERVKYTQKFEQIQQTYNIKFKRYIGTESILRTLGWSTSQINGYMFKKYDTPLNDDNIAERMLESTQYSISKQVDDV